LHRRAIAIGALVLSALSAPAAAQDVEAGRGKAATCIACHGPDGNSANPVFPSLAGQTQRYLYLELKDFKEGRRIEPQMTPFVANLSRQDMFDLAAFFSAQKLRSSTFKSDPEKSAKGLAKAKETLCTMCHQGNFKGQNEIPRVAGQGYAYIVKELKDFKTGRRTNDAGTMASLSKTLSDEDIENLANYLTTLEP
jgi:cytochrome c553